MKELSHLNKYLVKYKFHLIFGVLFIIIANFFAIVPAVIVRHAFDILQRSYGIFGYFEGFELQVGTYDLFVSSIVILAGLILVSAFLRGAFLFLMRQTIIVMSRLIEYDLKNEIFEEWVIYDTASLIQQLGFDLRAKARELGNQSEEVFRSTLGLITRQAAE